MKTAVVLLLVLAALTALLLMRVGVQAEYDGGGFTLRLRVGPVFRQVFPPLKGKAEKEKKPGKAKEPKPEKPKKQTGGKLSLIRAALPPALRTVKRLFGSLTTDRLDMVLHIAAPDPADTAVAYGRANALLGSLWQPAVSVLHVRDGHARVEADFDADTTSISLLIQLSLRIGQVLLLALAFAAQAAWNILRSRKDAANQ